MTFRFLDKFAMAEPDKPKRDDGGDTQTLERVKPKSTTRTRLRRPPRYKVLLHNDDYTPREFVVTLLRVVFHRGEAESRMIMLKAHTTGVALAGVYTKQIAETKVALVTSAAEEAGHPLLCTMEPADDGEDA